MRFIARAQVVVLAALAVLLLLGSAGGARAAQAGVYDTHFMRQAGVAPGQVKLAFPLPVGARALAVTDPGSLALLGRAQLGDVVKVDVDDLVNPTQITKVEQVTRWVGKGPRVLTFLIVAALLALVLAGVTRFRPLSLLVGKDGRYSNSQVQLALWFGAVALVYLSAVWLRFEWLGADFIGGVALTSNLIALTGLSAISFGGAKVITLQKIANAQGNASSSPPGSPPAGKTPGKPNLITDLFQNDQGDSDLGDVEMILITVLAVVIFVAASFHFLGKLALASPVTLPDVDTTLLAGFGIGQGAYLFKKAALPLGQG